MPTGVCYLSVHFRKRTFPQTVSFDKAFIQQTRLLTSFVATTVVAIPATRLVYNTARASFDQSFRILQTSS